MSKKTGLPKRIAGVKIPKELRRAAAALIEQAATPAGRELIAGALLAAAAALTRGLPAAVVPVPEGERAPGEATPPPRPPVDFGALLGLAATTAIGRLRAAEGTPPPR